MTGRLQEGEHALVSGLHRGAGLTVPHDGFVVGERRRPFRFPKGMRPSPPSKEALLLPRPVGRIPRSVSSRSDARLWRKLTRKAAGAAFVDVSRSTVTGCHVFV